VRTRAEFYGAEPDFYEKKDIHVHIPRAQSEAARRRNHDGDIHPLRGHEDPCAEGHRDDGEITLRGKCCRRRHQGKLLAAYRAGITTIVLPKESRKDLDDLPEEIRTVMGSTSWRTWTRSSA
jgi:ATP-dependent Lon protease